MDIALAYDPVNRRCDVVFNGVDFALDTTWQTPVLMSLGLDRRAQPGDDIPQPYLNPTGIPPLTNLKRGWPGDMLDPNGDLTGSRLWVFARSKLDTDGNTRRRVQSAAAESLAWSKRFGLSLTLTVQQIARNALAIRVQVGGTTIVVPQVIGT